LWDTDPVSVSEEVPLVTASPWPDHLLTLEEYFELPEDNSRHYELAEGVLQVSPRPVSEHQWAILQLWKQLDARLPADWVAITEVDVVVRRGFPSVVRAPDLIVTSRERLGERPKHFESTDVLLAVEVVSPGSRMTDNVTKAAEYAGAGIPHYWVITLEPEVSLAPHSLIRGQYERGKNAVGQYLADTPFDLTVDLAALSRF
jgi:Uma2 family endonuclease